VPKCQIDAFDEGSYTLVATVGFPILLSVRSQQVIDQKAQLGAFTRRGEEQRQLATLRRQARPDVLWSQLIADAIDRMTSSAPLSIGVTCKISHLHSFKAGLALAAIGFF
jgi:hypothetical protein